MKHLVDVALPLPIHRTFTYSTDGPAPPPVGSRVLVPFRREERIGWVVGPGEEVASGRVKSVLAVLDPSPTVSADLLQLCRWMASYYVTPLGIAIRTAMPRVLSDVSRDYVQRTGLVDDSVRPREARVLDWLDGREGPQRIRTLRKALGMGSVWPEVRSLTERGVLHHETVPPPPPSVKTRRTVTIVNPLETLMARDEAFGRAKRQREAYEFVEAAGGSTELATIMSEGGFSRSVITGLEGKELVSVTDEEEYRDPFADTEPGPPPDLTPTADQRRALDGLVGGLDEESPTPFVLQGITGSGKTLVYIELLREVLARGRSAVVLVPEISLTPQTVSRFRAHFADQVAVLHSGLSDGERYDAWRRLRSGERRIAVGARSALFAPLEDLGAIVVDEEHDGSYKQGESPRYHARDLAVVRARAHGAVCVLGSATPSLESWNNARTGRFRRLLLPERVGGGALPKVDVVDLRKERKEEKKAKKAGGGVGRGRGVFSRQLVDAVDNRLRREEQVILLLNRRGYSSFVQCRECGEVEQCENCSISLTYHRTTQRIVCHHCRFEAPAPSVCPRCGSDDLNFRGLGTEQVERVATEAFPEARIARMDVDTTSGKWAHQRILERVERHEVDILLGTQMIAKGLDFPRVTLVGVVNADVGMHLPDFRASERTFQLLSQVAGRAGRSSLGGSVIVQTSMPDHYAIQAAVRHDLESFSRRELEERKDPPYAPHVRLVNVVISSPDQRLVLQAAEESARWMRGLLRSWGESGGGPGSVGKDAGEVEVVGPAPAPIERLHQRWRWHFLLRSPSPRGLGAAARALMESYRPPPGDVRITLDRDPVALL